MKNAMIAQVLKEYRKSNKLSVRDVSKKFEEKSMYVAEKTIYGWESGQTQPDADTLLVLCDIYNIDNILGTFGYSDEPVFHITQFEKRLIQRFREKPEMQDAVAKLLDLEEDE